MADLGREAASRGYMPPMDMVQAYTSAEEGAAPVGATVEALRQQGNDAMRAGDHAGARDLYTRALEAVGESGAACGVLHILFGNRSAASLKLADPKAALRDAEECTAASPGYVKGWFRKASALAMLGRRSAMAEAAQQGLRLDPGNRELREILREAEASDVGPAAGPPPGT